MHIFFNILAAVSSIDFFPSVWMTKIVKAIVARTLKIGIEIEERIEPTPTGAWSPPNTPTIYLDKLYIYSYSEIKIVLLCIVL